MGLGKTVQTLARIVEGRRTPAEQKAGFSGVTLYEKRVTELKTQYHRSSGRHGAMGCRDPVEDDARIAARDYSSRSIASEA